MRKSFGEKERRCQETFISIGPWWHLYTPGKTTPIILSCREDYLYAMNLMARCVFEIDGIAVIAFEIMSNHIHVVLSGIKEQINEFFALYRRRLARYLSTRSQAPMNMPSQFQMCLKPLVDLKAIRNEIVYVNRNGYVIDSDSTPFSYKWGTGRYYFNDFPFCQRLEDLGKNELRAFLKSSTNNLPGTFSLIEGHIAPSSFCDIKLGMSMFRDAHHYFNMVSKNVESYTSIATEMDDGEFLTDEELFWELQKTLNSKYNTSYVKQLTPAQKLDLARDLHYKYHSSNGQIRRLLYLTQYEVDQLFPTRQ